MDVTKPSCGTCSFWAKNPAKTADGRELGLCDWYVKLGGMYTFPIAINGPSATTKMLDSADGWNCPAYEAGEYVAEPFAGRDERFAKLKIALVPSE